MSEEIHRFKLTSSWNGTSDGDGTITTGWGKIAYGIPEGLGGAPGRSNPEEMLIGAVASCYSITFAMLAERKRLDPPTLEMVAEGEVVRQPDKTLKFTAIKLSPTITISNATQRDAVLDCARKAEGYCLVSRALRGNVEITVVPEIIVAE